MLTTDANDPKTPRICSICAKDIPAKGGWLDGNNAEPVNAGRCCDWCDAHIVIPARLERLKRNLPMRQIMED